MDCWERETPQMMNCMKKRVGKELKQISLGLNGITCDSFYPESDIYSKLLAVMQGPEGSPYEDGQFKIKMFLGPAYPWRPPVLKFVTPIYHPNIDEAGKVCLDLLRQSPEGTYDATISLEGILLSVKLLLANPNLEKPVNVEAAALYKTNLEQFNEKVREHVKTHCPSKK